MTASKLLVWCGCFWFHVSLHFFYIYIYILYFCTIFSLLFWMTNFFFNLFQTLTSIWEFYIFNLFHFPCNSEPCCIQTWLMLEQLWLVLVEIFSDIMLQPFNSSLISKAEWDIHQLHIILTKPPPDWSASICAIKSHMNGRGQEKGVGCFWASR